ncbi:MAG: TetR/AcrR family transcriptional regulator [Janthinobacterium lividum]
MTSRQRNDRRAEALSKERIVEAAIEILDREGETGLTFRALATRLSTGSGALYWHVADKGALLAAASDAIVGRVMATVEGGTEPRAAMRAIALGIFDAIDAHPWVGRHLSHEPGQPATLLLFESIGGRLRPLGVPERAQFDAWSALVNYILGVARQNAENARGRSGDTDRTTLLTAVAARWARLDQDEHPFLRQVAAQLAHHDDREQFLAGIDLILAGIVSLR